MKQTILLTILLSTLVFCQSYAQRFKADVIAGFNASQVDGDETAGFNKLGLNTGAGVTIPLYRNWGIGLETIFSQEGSRLRPQFNDSLDGSYKLLMNYVRVPLRIQYVDKNLVSGGAGVSWGRLVKIEEFRDGFPVDSVTLLDGPFKRDDWQLFADFSIRVYKTFKVNLRYSYSLTKIAHRLVQDSETGNMNMRKFYHNLWAIRLIYTINEAAPEKQKLDRIAYPD